MADGTGSTKQRLVVSPFDAHDSTCAPRIEIGDTIVYAAHGIGTIVARERSCVGETERECVVTEFGTGLRVTLSLDDAAERMRPVADKADLDRVGDILATTCGARDGSWTRRIRESKAKLARGLPGDLAEIVLDGAGREASVPGNRLSDGERRVYLRARELLAREISAARQVDVDQADDWIDEQIGSFQERED
jgi:CarD family transcriptional regulator